MKEEIKEYVGEVQGEKLFVETSKKAMDSSRLMEYANATGLKGGEKKNV